MLAQTCRDPSTKIETTTRSTGVRLTVSSCHGQGQGPSESTLTGGPYEGCEHHDSGLTVQRFQTATASTAPSNGVFRVLVGHGAPIGGGRVNQGGGLVHLTAWGQLRRDAHGQPGSMALRPQNV